MIRELKNYLCLWLFSKVWQLAYVECFLGEYVGRIAGGYRESLCTSECSLVFSVCSGLAKRNCVLVVSGSKDHGNVLSRPCDESFRSRVLSSGYVTSQAWSVPWQ